MPLAFPQRFAVGCNDNATLDQHAVIAQLIERLPCKQDVRGLNPRDGTKFVEMLFDLSQQ